LNINETPVLRLALAIELFFVVVSETDKSRKEHQLCGACRLDVARQHGRNFGSIQLAFDDIRHSKESHAEVQEARDPYGI
jgi:hypothetical protein